MSKLDETRKAQAVRVAAVCICTRYKVNGKTYEMRSPSCRVHSEHENLRIKNLGAMQPGARY